MFLQGIFLYLGAYQKNDVPYIELVHQPNIGNKESNLVNTVKPFIFACPLFSRVSRLPY